LVLVFFADGLASSPSSFSFLFLFPSFPSAFFPPSLFFPFVFLLFFFFPDSLPETDPAESEPEPDSSPESSDSSSDSESEGSVKLYLASVSEVVGSAASAHSVAAAKGQSVLRILHHAQRLDLLYAVRKYSVMNSTTSRAKQGLFQAAKPTGIGARLVPTHTLRIM
jgi:hypothetical protein